MKTNFIWGVATAAPQVEGAWLEGGKGLNIWDAYTHTPGKIANGDTSEVACDHYHRLEEDIGLIADLGGATDFPSAGPAFSQTARAP